MRQPGALPLGAARRPRRRALLRDFLLRAYPDQHIATSRKRMFKTPEYCAACHKQFIDKEVNSVGWVQLQNQYDNWKARAAGTTRAMPHETIECRECHMPLVASHDPASGDAADYNRSPDDGKHRSHRFLGANQIMPRCCRLPEGGEQQVALVEQWLRGEMPIPEIADKWARDRRWRSSSRRRERCAPGEEVPVRAVHTSNKVGHDFPTGPLDIIQAWVEVTVTDESGRGRLRTPADATSALSSSRAPTCSRPSRSTSYGNLIDRHNLWEMVGVRYRRSLFPGAAEVARFDFPCPASAGEMVRDLPVEERMTVPVPAGASGKLTVDAKLNYRKVDQYLITFAFGEDSKLTSPVTVVSTARAEIRVLPGADAATGGGAPGASGAGNGSGGR